MARYHNINGVKTQFTAEEETARDTEEAGWEVQQLATQYIRDRQMGTLKDNGYPSVGDQLDMMMKDMRDGTTTHQTACEAVKTKFPKPA